MLTLSAQYGLLPKLPAVPGNEGLGRVVAVGSDVKNVSPGDLVLLPAGAGTWREKLLAPAVRLVPMPATADRLQLAMLTVNPPTALLLLRDIVDLKAGEWVIQNAANSGVGSYLITLAELRGLKTVNVVRRESLVAALKSRGPTPSWSMAPTCTSGLPTPRTRPPFAWRSTPSAATPRRGSAHSVGPGGTVVNYGALSGEPCHVTQQDLIFRNVMLRGFWLAHWFNQATPPGSNGRLWPVDQTGRRGKAAHQDRGHVHVIPHQRGPRPRHEIGP